MTETKICEQCQAKKDIECFYRRPQRHDPNKRIKICSDCYKQNLADSRRQQEEHQRQWQEEQRQRQAQEETERAAKEQRRQARALELSIQANKRCPRCKQVRTDGDLWIFSNGKEHLHFQRYCQVCTDTTPHLIYRLICPILKQIRYIGITSQPIKRRLSEHMHKNSGTKQKCAWIDTLRAHNLTALIEVIDTAPNEQQAQKAEQAWIDHYIQLGCPLTNNEASIAQRVIDVQSGRIPSQEEIDNLYRPARHFRLERASATALQITRWYNRTQCAYSLNTTYSSHVSLNTYHYHSKAQEYDRAIFESDLPERKAEREAILCNVTIAYLYWDESLIIWRQARKQEDIRYLWDKHIPLICTKIEKDGTSITGFVTDLTQENHPIVHPFSYNVDPTRALIVSPSLSWE